MDAPALWDEVMPNGGSDCCGNRCWFNDGGRSKGYCVIRQLEISSPMYTYCANHPRRNPDRIEVPLGPAFVGDSTGRRELWQPSPDTEEVRLALLELLANIAEQPTNEYPIGIYRDEIVIWQLGEFKEQRAIEHLQRIANFEPNAETGEPFHRSRQSTVRAAIAALQKIQAQEDG